MQSRRLVTLFKTQGGGTRAGAACCGSTRDRAVARVAPGEWRAAAPRISGHRARNGPGARSAAEATGRWATIDSSSKTRDFWSPPHASKRRWSVYKRLRRRRQESQFATDAHSLFITYSCSLYHIRLQPLSHTVAASITYGCRSLT